MKLRLTYVYVAFIMSFAIIIGISKILFDEIEMIRESNDLVEHTHMVKNQILLIQMKLAEAESSQRGYLLTKDEGLLDPVSSTQKKILADLRVLDSLIRDNKDQQKISKQLKETISRRYQFLYSSITIYSQGTNEQFRKNIAEGKVIMSQFGTLADKMDNEENRLLNKRRNTQKIYENTAPRYLILILLISCILLGISFITIIKALNKQREYQIILENKIKDLNNTNAEIEQIAFVASHDLQEPLRKIRTFSDRLMTLHLAELKEDGKKILEKMAVSSQRMQELLNDLINFTGLTKNEEEQNAVDLKACFSDVCKDLQPAISLKKAIIQTGDLPVINGYYKQLYLLFFNLIDNALKFSKADIAPVITVFAAHTDGNEIDSTHKFIKITIRDNGIGFKKEFASKIFIIFQRLHNQTSSLPGKGIGLAICKRVMINHKGAITASGELGMGARFNLYFPKHRA